MPRHAAKRCVRQTAGTPHSPTTSSAEDVVQPCSIAASVIIEKESGAGSALRRLAVAPDNGVRTGSGIRSRRSEFTTTRTLEPAITAAARTGCRRPSAARVKRNQVVSKRPYQVGEDRQRTARATSTTHGSIHNPSRGQDQRGSFAGEVGRGTDGDTDIRVGEHRPVIEAVADHRDDVVPLAQLTQGSPLGLRGQARLRILDPGRDGNPLCRMRKVAAQQLHVQRPRRRSASTVDRASGRTESSSASAARTCSPQPI